MTLEALLQNRQKLSTKIVGALVAFMALALLVIGVTLWLSWQLEGSAAAINDTGSLRMNSYRLNLLLTRLKDEPPDEPPARALAERQLHVLDTTLAQVAQGDPQRPLFLPPANDIRIAFGQVEQEWRQTLRPLADAILRGRPGLNEFQLRVERFAGQVDALVQLIERDSEKRTFWLRASQLTLLALALVGTISLIFLMFSLIIEPVSRLHEGMVRMRDRDFDVRLEVDSDDEFGQMSPKAIF